MTALCTALALHGGAPCLRKQPALVRCWCRELSVLDCEVGGERWVFFVPARAANDAEVGKSHNAPGYGASPHPGDTSCPFNRYQAEKGSHGIVVRAPTHQNREKAVRHRLAKAALTDWLRSEVSP